MKPYLQPSTLIHCFPALILALVFSGSAFAQQPAFLTNGLLAYYPFNGNAKDASGNGNHGIASNVLPCQDRFGVSSNALCFLSANSANVDISILLPELTGLTGATFCAWLKSDFSQPGGILFGDWSHGPTSPNSGLFWGVAGNSHDGFALNMDNHAGYNGITTESVLDTNWHQVMLVFDGSASSDTDRALFYIDGTIARSMTLPNYGPVFGTIGAGDSICIGRRAFLPGNGTWGGYLNGALSDFRIYTRALSTSEALALYHYESVPRKTDPRPATATATVVNGFVVGATITDGGSGYTTIPNVVVSGGGGTGATAIATIDANGVVNAIKFLTSGSGYTGIPVITIDPPPFPPSQAKGTATVINGFVTGVTITDTGHGYEGVLPPITFLGGGGTGATGIAIVNNGMVTGINLSSSGSGYTNTPDVLIAAPPGLPSVDIGVHSVDVTLHLIPGYTYKIQTTTDFGSTWTDVESGILAVATTVVKTFNVASSAQFFRVVQTN
jgi:hypothetical protein